MAGESSVTADFGYLRNNPQEYCSIDTVGYTNSQDGQKQNDCKTVQGINGEDWYYSDRAFVDFKNRLQDRLKWIYHDEIEVVLLQSNPEGRSILNFENYLAVDINHGMKQGYIDSFQKFMGALVRASKKEVEVKAAAGALHQSRYSIKDIVAASIDECKKVPQPVRKIIKDKLFYRTSKSYGST